MKKQPVQSERLQPRESRKGPALAGAGLMALLGIATLIKTCVTEDTAEKVVATSKMPDASVPEPAVLRTVLIENKKPLADAGFPVVIPPPLVKKEEKSPLVQACDDFVDPDSKVTPYDALRAVTALTHEKDEKDEKDEEDEEDDDKIYSDVGSVINACNLRLGDAMGALKRGLHNGDTRLADVANDFFEGQCAKEFKYAEEKRGGMYGLGKCTDVNYRSPYSKCEIKILDEAIAHCSKIPDFDEKKQTCGAGFKERIVQQCGELSRKSPRGECQIGVLKEIEDVRRQNKEDEAKCPAIKAGEFGMDIDHIRQLAGQRNASILATKKLALINPQTSFSDDDAVEYLMALRALIGYQTSDASLFKNIGVADAADFEAQYIKEVIFLLKGRGEKGKRHAEALEAIWMMRGILKD